METGKLWLRQVATIVALAALVVSCETMKSKNAAKTKTELKPLTKAELRILHKMGGKVIDDRHIAIGKVKIDRLEKEVLFPAKINMDAGPIEVLICTPQGRAHESLLVSDADPLNIQLALILSGAANGARKPPPKGAEGPLQGDLFDVFVLDENGKKKSVEKLLVDLKKNAPPEKHGWVFVGSKFTSNGRCLATREGNIIVTWSSGNTVFDNPADNGDVDDDINVNNKLGLKIGDVVTVVLRKRANNE
jgi:hypothetical protein